MAEVVLFHHAQGLTEGVRAFAEHLRAAGHTVHMPDLFEGRTFATLEEGVAYAEETGFETIIERGRAAAAGLPGEVVYAGFSLGVLPAQALAQARPGTLGALLMHSCVPPQALGTDWPDGLPAQIHVMEDDPLAVEEDIPAARALAEAQDGVELFLYPGDGHLFTDRSLPGYDLDAARLLMGRVLAFLSRPAGARGG